MQCIADFLMMPLFNRQAGFTTTTGKNNIGLLHLPVHYNHHLKCQSVIFYTASSIVGRGKAGAYLQQSIGGRRGTPWTGRQSIAGQHTNNHTHTHTLINTPKGNLERPINLTG
ncbi:hypothetical protein AMECASPLE_034181 [Ameca splendens]|uniref:Uncharacterized protein n=1 Tax=Ameca splendens TaxID=208324 RepID=A0ABV1ADH4_9TELE